MEPFNNLKELLWIEKHYNNDPGNTVCCLCGENFYLDTITAIVQGDRKKLREMGPNGKTMIIGFVGAPLCDNCLQKTEPKLLQEIKIERKAQKKEQEEKKANRAKDDEKVIDANNKVNKKSMFLEWEFYVFMFLYFIHVQILAVLFDLSGKMGLLSFAIAFTLYYLIWYPDKKITLKKIALTILWLLVAHIASIILAFAFFILLEIFLLFF